MRWGSSTSRSARISSIPILRRSTWARPRRSGSSSSTRRTTHPSSGCGKARGCGWKVLRRSSAGRPERACFARAVLRWRSAPATTSLGPEMALVLTRADVASLLTLDDCIAAVEDAFRRVGTGEARPAGILGFPVPGGGFHLKAAALRDRFAAKVNGNFSANPARGLPAIQGAIVLSDAADGRVLAILDSIEITILRTGAATAVAARHLARRSSEVATICGCGNQGRVQLRALARVLPLRRAFLYDVDPARAATLARELRGELRMEIEPAADLARAVEGSDVCVTCTPSRTPFLRRVRPGTFVAAVGADSPEK